MIHIKNSSFEIDVGFKRWHVAVFAAIINVMSWGILINYLVNGDILNN